MCLREGETRGLEREAPPILSHLKDTPVCQRLPVQSGLANRDPGWRFLRKECPLVSLLAGFS